MCGCDIQYRLLSLHTMYGYLHLATIKDHFNKERYRLRGRDGGLGELPGCSLSIHSGGLGARTGVPKRDVQTHKKEGNHSRCAHGGARMCVMVKTWLQALHNSLFSACHSPAPSRSLTYKKKLACDILVGRVEEMSHSITKKLNLNRLFVIFLELFFAENLANKLVTEGPDDQCRPCLLLVS